jgi:hypothetical protein
MTRMFVIFVLTCIPTLAAAQEMKPGLWEIDTSMKMQDMQLPGARFTHCYTAKDIAAGKQYSADEESKCTITNMKTSGGHVSYDMACAIEGGKMAGSVKGTMSATSYNFDQKMRMTPDHGMGEMHSIIKGRRLGDCK